MLTSLRRLISYPNPDRSDRPDIPLHIKNLLDFLDLDVVYNQGTDAARLAAAHFTNGGRFWWCTDTLILWYDDGTNWQDLRTLADLSVTAAKLADQTINVQAGNYTLVLADRYSTIRMTSAVAATLTVPPNSAVAFGVGASVDIMQYGAGQITLTPGSGVTILGNPGLKTVGQYVTVSLLKIATDTWVASGALTP